MKITFTKILLVAALFASGQAPLIKQWDHTYGGNDDETMSKVIQTSDLGFLVAGFTRSDSSGDVTEVTRGGNDFWIVKTDSLGVKQWDKRFGGDFQERLYGVAQLPDGGYILGGFTTSDSAGDVSQHTKGGMDYWLVRTDAAGNKIWDKRYGGLGYDNFSTLSLTSDGGFILGGWTYSDSTGDISHHSRGGEDYWVVKTDSLGNIQWDKSYGGIDSDEMTSVVQTSDGGFLFGGNTISDSSGDISEVTRGGMDMWIVKTDGQGNKIWDKRFGGSAGDGCGSVREIGNKIYLIGGGTGSNISGDVSQPPRDTTSSGTNWGDVWVLKIDSAGIKIWDKRYGGSFIDGSAGPVSKNTDGGFLIGANSFSGMSGEKSENNFGSTQSWIIKTDSAGTKSWDKTIFTLGADNGGFAMQTMDDNYLVANNSSAAAGSYKTENSRGNADFWVIKFRESETPQLPVADFTVSPGGLCAGGCFDFSNLSTNSSTFRWYFPGATPDSSTAVFPSGICYADSGQHDVTLIAINGAFADTLVFQNAVNVFGIPPVTITQSADTLFATQGYDFYQWYRNNVVILNDTNPFHVLTLSGDYSVLVIDYNGCPNYDTLFAVTMVGLNELSLQNIGINVYPNPFTDVLKLKKLNDVIGNELSIYNVMGQKVYSTKIVSSEMQLHPDLLPGVYFLRVNYGDKEFFSRVVKQ